MRRSRICKQNKMSDTPWSQKQIFWFLEALQAEPVIWDPNERSHKDKKKVNDAWERIQKVINIPILDLKRKKESLVATYRGYYRKKEASIRSGACLDEIYRPIWFAYDYIDSFLGSVYKCKQTLAVDRNIVPDSVESEEERDASNFSEPLISQTSVDAQNSTKTAASTIAQNRTVRRRHNPPELQVASKQMSEAFNNLNKVMNRAGKDNVEDEYDIFGKLLQKN